MNFKLIIWVLKAYNSHIYVQSIIVSYVVLFQYAGVYINILDPLFQVDPRSRTSKWSLQYQSFLFLSGRVRTQKGPLFTNNVPVHLLKLQIYLCFFLLCCNITSLFLKTARQRLHWLCTFWLWADCLCLLI